MIGALLLGLLVPGWTILVVAGFSLGAVQAVLRRRPGRMSFQWQTVQSESASWRSFWIRCIIISSIDSVDCDRGNVALCVFISSRCTDFFLMLWLTFMNKLPRGQMAAPIQDMKKPSLLFDRGNRMIVVLMICFAFFYAGIETNFANFYRRSC